MQTESNKFSQFEVTPSPKRLVTCLFKTSILWLSFPLPGKLIPAANPATDHSPVVDAHNAHPFLTLLSGNSVHLKSSSLWKFLNPMSVCDFLRCMGFCLLFLSPSTRRCFTPGAQGMFLEGISLLSSTGRLCFSDCSLHFYGDMHIFLIFSHGLWGLAEQLYLFLYSHVQKEAQSGEETGVKQVGAGSLVGQKSLLEGDAQQWIRPMICGEELGFPEASNRL